jgi:hypothetical protein
MGDVTQDHVRMPGRTFDHEDPPAVAEGAPVS